MLGGAPRPMWGTEKDGQQGNIQASKFPWSWGQRSPDAPWTFLPFVEASS